MKKGCGDVTERSASELQNSGCGSSAAGNTKGFRLAVGPTSGNCKAGDDWSTSALRDRKIPVLSCEGPCIKGEIARRAASLLPRQNPRFKRACHGEAFFVPHSAMAAWVREADAVLMIDGCFLSCHGRVLKNLVPSDRIIQVNAHAIHRKHADVFSSEEIPEQEILELAEKVARQAGAMAPLPMPGG